MRAFASIGLILSLASAPSVVLAETSEDPKPAPDPAATEPKELGFGETVEVEGELPAVPPSNLTTLRMPSTPQETPASVSVIPEALTDTQDARMLTDALKNASGVNVAPGFGVFDFFVIRGFDSLSSGLVLVDGAPEPESTFYPLYNVRQVEALKGPGSFLYGGNAAAGAVQLVRKQPVSRSFADMGVSYGSFGTLDATLDANASRSDGKLAFRLDGLYRDSNGYRDDKDSRQYAVNPALLWRPNADTRVRLNAEYVKSEFQPDSGIPLAGVSPTYAGTAIPDVPRTRSYQSPFDSSDQDVWRLRLDAEHRFNDRFLLRDKVYFTDLDWKSDGTLLLGIFPSPTLQAEVARTLPLLDDRQKMLGNQLEGLLNFTTGSVRHEAIVGFELLRFTDVFDLAPALLPGIDLRNPVETAQQPLFILDFARQSGDAKSVILSPYLVDRLSFGEKLKLFVGGRLDSLDYEEPVSHTDRDDTQFSPMGGLIFSPEPTFSIYASAGGGFAPPSTLVVGERKPETTWQFEGGVKKTFCSGRAFASLAGYHIEKNDVAIPDSSGITRQIGDQESSGVEAELSAELAHGLTAFAAYGFNDSELTHFTELQRNPFDPTQFFVLDHSGNTAAFAPRHLFNLWAVKEFDNGIGIGAGLRTVSSQFIAENNTFELDSYATADAMLSYRRKNVRLSVNFKNLTDTEYFTRGFGSASVLPADKFAVYARVELRLGKTQSP
jgi:TonB-dependent siderophore receptor